MPDHRFSNDGPRGRQRGETGSVPPHGRNRTQRLQTDSTITKHPPSYIVGLAYGRKLQWVWKTARNVHRDGKALSKTV